MTISRWSPSKTRRSGGAYPDFQSATQTHRPQPVVVYYDPTHLNPLPPEPLRFVVEARGLGHIEVMRLHPQLESQLREGVAQMHQIVDGLMFGAQDYALVAYKN